MTPAMSNQRKKGIVRVTVTLPDEMLAEVERVAEATGKDRLALIRAAITRYLKQTPTRPKRAAGGKE